MNNDIKNYNIDETKFFFTTFISGIKGIPYETTVLIHNNIECNAIDLIYESNNNKEIRRIDRNIIKNISFISRMRSANTHKEVRDEETKGMLLSFVLFGGSPIAQMAGKSGFNSLFNSLSDNYDKVDFDVEYQITIQSVINNEIHNFVFRSDVNPESFINSLNFKN